MRYPARDTEQRYTDPDGVEHLLVVELDRGGAWCVLDVTATDCRLVERLGGVDDGDEQVAAIVEQYLDVCHAYTAGERDRMPCPHPLPDAELRQCPPNIIRPGSRAEPLRLLEERRAA